MTGFESEALLLPAIALYALSVGSFAFLRPSLVIVYTLFGLSGFFGAGQTPLGYSKIIAQWFNKERGLALGIIQAGIGIGGIFVAQLARVLIADFGWRKAYFGIGIAIFMVAFLLVAICFRSESLLPFCPRASRRGKASARIRWHLV